MNNDDDLIITQDIDLNAPDWKIRQLLKIRQEAMNNPQIGSALALIAAYDSVLDDLYKKVA